MKQHVQEVQLSEISCQKDCRGSHDSTETAAAVQSGRGSYWSQKAELGESAEAKRPVATNAHAVKLFDWTTAQGLLLYVLSTLLLSVQATSAKLLGKSLATASSCSLESFGYHIVHSVRFHDAQVYTTAGTRGIGVAVMVLFRSLAILVGAVLCLLYSRPAKPFGT